MNKNDLPFIFIYLFFIGFFLLSQEKIEYGSGHPYDAGAYYKMANQVASGDSIISSKPFVYRVALPYLVGKLFPNDILSGFIGLNFLFAVLILVALFYLFGAYEVKIKSIYLVMILYVTNPLSYFRFTLFYPVFTDPAALLFIILIFLVNKNIKYEEFKKYIIISLLSFVGVFFREIVLIAPIVISSVYILNLFIYKQNIFYGIKSSLINLMPILFGIIGILLTHLSVTPIGEGYGFLSHASDVLTHNISNPEVFFLAIFIVFGPVLFLIFATINSPNLFCFFKSNKEIPIYIIYILLLSTFSGYHTDRIVFWAFPAILTVIGHILGEKLIKFSKWKHNFCFYVPLVITQLLTFRVFTTIPNADFDALSAPGKADFILFAPYGENLNFGQIFASNMAFQSRWVLLLQFSLLMIYLSVIIIWSKRKA